MNQGWGGTMDQLTPIFQNENPQNSLIVVVLAVAGVLITPP
jgi:hypothetical protein